jgi:hypothetical protein
VTPRSQPLPVPAQAASPTRHLSREAIRLLGIWVDLAERVASANAHHTRDEEPLRELQLQVEDAISDRHPECDELMIELVAWESTLIHVAARQTAPETCLTCRKVRAQIPLQLPIPTRGGTR